MFSMIDILAFITENFINKLDYTLSYVAVTLLFFLYGTSFVKFLARHIGGSRVRKLLVFFVLAFFGINLVFLYVFDLILGVTYLYLKWSIIILILSWSIYKFDRMLCAETIKKN